MATRSRTSFQKRQKEIARMEKQRDKAARRLQRKEEAGKRPADSDIEGYVDPDLDPDASVMQPSDTSPGAPE
ncbi:MAG: hypothetical protein ACKV22_14540 [Bryobacteraceae bacterium]